MSCKYLTPVNYRYSKAESAEVIVRISKRQRQAYVFIVVVYGRHF